ncbi:hypothetical protein LPB86_17075 [Pedobacter sp. MC2016-14]|uniref:hypothetical protein n=1 Tax=Pedobacter sp. MC2016-14 TaxID=2897327 RepID=UPI001E4748E7|nr:hypothetical protein [Pedobacter sp. MC2016-14]MCD0489958.1 hypothetical protein [Pedobacter sp. MC2016-14]
MVIRIADFKVRITKNKNNRFWNPIGRFWNITEILINGEWFKCGLVFREDEGKYFVAIDHPMKVDELTSMIIFILKEGTYAELPVSKAKMVLIRYLQNRHRINEISFALRKGVFDRKRTVLIFSLALVPSIMFYIINASYENIIIHLIAENTWVQTFFFFLTVSGFIGIFHPFTIRKELTEKDIKKMAKEVIEEEKRNEIIRRNASI